jgi:hypothetical protein
MDSREQMERKELKEIIKRVIDQVKQESTAPKPACLYGDKTPGPTTEYAVGEEG